MSLHVVPNSGLFNDPELDRLRSDALIAVADPAALPEALVYYLRALEAQVLDAKAEYKKRFITEHGWTFKR